MSPRGFFFLGNCLRPPKARFRSPSPWIPSPTFQSPPRALFRLFLSAPTLPPKCSAPVQPALILSCNQPFHCLVVTPNASLPTFPCRQVMIISSVTSFFLFSRHHEGPRLISSDFEFPKSLLRTPLTGALIFHPIDVSKFISSPRG